MKKLLLILCLAVAVPLAPIGCKTPPSERVVQVQTLKAVGHTAEAAVSSSAQLYAAGLITAQQARRVADLYDKEFQPAYRVAVNAVNANLESIAAPELAGLAAQLAALVAQYQAKPQASMAHPVEYLAKDGVNTITDYGNGITSSTLVFVTK